MKITIFQAIRKETPPQITDSIIHEMHRCIEADRTNQHKVDKWFKEGQSKRLALIYHMSVLLSCNIEGRNDFDSENDFIECISHNQEYIFRLSHFPDGRVNNTILAITDDELDNLYNLIIKLSI